jgi:hypothetical protein
MCLQRAPEKYIAGAALDRAGLDSWLTDGCEVVCLEELGLSGTRVVKQDGRVG